MDLVSDVILAEDLNTPIYCATVYPHGSAGTHGITHVYCALHQAENSGNGRADERNLG